MTTTENTTAQALRAEADKLRAQAEHLAIRADELDFEARAVERAAQADSDTATYQILIWTHTPGQDRRASILRTTMPADADPERVIKAKWQNASAYRPDRKVVGPWLPFTI